ncbi:restriction endonuclease [Thioclava sp. F36-6]|uniref:restriction endonuclease n=1 Tax=Thioclava sp. F36-6 TaxID=1915316 RepID=UPI0009967258|nr:restriction endonuclease [Thioclava sp. F36-6]OOY31257.1 hypothetical protein BMI88_09050 [Thioclava sp. F36-6]
MKRLWKVALGKNGEYEAGAFAKSVLTVDFNIHSDISHAKDRDGLIAVMETAFPDAKHKTHLNFAAQMNQFINVIQIDDLIICPVKTSSTISIARVTGDYKPDPETGSPTRAVQWLKTDLPRDTFKQDLLYSFGAFMTVCEISRNNALARVEQVIAAGKDPGDGTTPSTKPLAPVPDADTVSDAASEAMVDLDQIARDQIEKRIASVFTGHDLTTLVAAILQAQGMKVRVSPPGADGGIDLVAGSGPLGLESPRIVAQVKSGTITVQHPDLQGLIGSVQDTQADYGLLVSWNGFTPPVRKRLNELYFRVRFWGRQEIVDNLFSVYEELPEAIRAELPLRRTWTLVPDEGEDG